jgi:nicotinamide mononucleotide (NMN) deamidase PncC
MEACMVDIINMKVNLMEVDKETLEEGEVMEAMVEIIKVNNQIVTQIVIKGNMMHIMESCSKGIMHQLAIKVMNNCL